MPAKPTTPQTPTSLHRSASVIQEAATTLSALATMLESSGLEVLEVTHHASFTKALEFLDNYNAAIRSALVTARKERGDFEATVSAPATKSPRKPASKQRRSGHLDT